MDYRLTGSASDSGLPCSACIDDEFSLLRSSDGFDSVTMRQSSSLPEGSFQLDWQLPRAPVRFPLRDALLSFQDMTSVGSVQEISAGSSTSTRASGPLMVKMTEKAKFRKYMSHRKRYDLDPPGFGEMHSQPIPRAPPDTTARKAPKKALNSLGTENRAQVRRNAQSAAWDTWAPEGEHHDPVQNAGPGNQVIRGTLTSSARAVLSHSRRFAVESVAAETSLHGGGSHSSSKPKALDPMAAWSPMRQSRGLPRPVKEWVCRGLEFTDAGLGIGDRFDKDLEIVAARAPGHIYEQDYGNIARWKAEASMPTKQPVGRFHSAETHKIGARRSGGGKQDRQRPGPGTYEFMGFAQEIVHKLSKRPKGEAPRTLSPPSSPKGSSMMQASGSVSQG